jgi:two-component system, OmpR family, phosphate regulon sensor histidine kinase PhoR
MRIQEQQPDGDRDKYYESASRAIRWIVLGLVLVTFPPDAPNAIPVLTGVAFIGLSNALRYSRRLRSLGLFASRANSLAVDHIFALMLIALTGGLASPYYPLIFVLIIGMIASFGIAGFAISLASQIILALTLYSIELTPSAFTAGRLLTIQLGIVVVFSLLAEQLVRNRDEEYLLAGGFSRQVKNERQRLLALINSLSHAVLAINSEGKIYLYNAAALELLNTNRDISGSPINELLPLKDEHGRKVGLTRLINDENRALNRQDLHFPAGDGSDMILDLTISPVHLFGDQKAGTGGFMVVFRDITKEKSLDEERDEFISVTSHELRTPLAIAEANLSTALLPNFASIEPKAKELVVQAHDNIIFLSAMIEDLAALSRAERGDLKLELELIDARALAEDLVRDYRPQAQAKHLDLKLELADGLGAIVTSRLELREILQNFLTNALKYTVAGSVTLKAKPAEGGGTEFSVSDTGIGVSASDKAKIFDKFYRSEDYRTRATGGTGLGLYITHKLAEKLGVQINFTSRLNHGSTFTVLVPVRTDGSATQAVAAAALGQKSEPTPPFVGKSHKRTVEGGGQPRDHNNLSSGPINA